MVTPDRSGLISIVEQSEISLWRSLWEKAPAEVERNYGLQWHEQDGVSALVTEKIPAWFFNRVMGLGLIHPITNAQLDDWISLYHNRGLPIGISLSPLAQPEELEDFLASRGFTEANRWAKMYRPAVPPININTDLRIETASAEQAELFAEIVVTGFELDEGLRPLFAAAARLPKNHAYIAWDNKVPVAAGMLSIDEEVGHLNTAATLPEARGRGAQGAIMARRIQDGIEAGCHWLATETWIPGDQVNHSYNNMLRHGFELAYERPNLVLAPGC